MLEVKQLNIIFKIIDYSFAELMIFYNKSSKYLKKVYEFSEHLIYEVKDFLHHLKAWISYLVYNYVEQVVFAYSHYFEIDVINSPKQHLCVVFFIHY